MRSGILPALVLAAGLAGAALEGACATPEVAGEAASPGAGGGQRARAAEARGDDGHGPPSAHEGAHEDELLVGAKLQTTGAWTKDRGETERELLAGTSLFVERSVGAGLEVELGAGWLRVVDGGEDGAWDVPIDLILKMPFHPSHVIEPYVGLGIITTIEHRGDDTEVRYGVSSHGGAYLWLSRHWGIDIDLEGNALLDHDPTFELGIGVGPVYRF